MAHVAVSLHDYRYVDGDMPVQEMLALCRILRYRRPQSVFEIGTFEGGTTLQMAANCEAQILTLDLDPSRADQRVVTDPSLDVYPYTPGARFMGTPYASRITQLYGDSQCFDFGPYAQKMELVFVDACHHYEWVRKDSESALAMVAPGGAVIWHDYAPYAPGVVRALDELAPRIGLRQIRGTSLVIYERAVVE